MQRVFGSFKLCPLGHLFVSVRPCTEPGLLRKRRELETLQNLWYIVLVLLARLPRRTARHRSRGICCPRAHQIDELIDCSAMEGRARSCWGSVALAAAILLIGSCQAFTLSSKMVHRFSDEAKRVFAQKHGRAPGFWPRKGSAPYYKMLHSQDYLRNQRRKLIAEYQSLYFSQGNKTVEFGESFGWLHYTWVDIGTPNVSFLVALDTGSDLFWVPCDCIQCAPTSASSYGLELSGVWGI